MWQGCLKLNYGVKKRSHIYAYALYGAKNIRGEGGREGPIYSNVFQEYEKKQPASNKCSLPIFKSCLFPKHLMLCQIPDTITAGQEEGTVFGMGQDVLLRRFYEKRIIALFNPTPGFWDYQFCIVTHTCSTNICFHEFSMIYWSRSDFLVSISPL